MCGHVGIIGKITDSDKAMFKYMLDVDGVARGKHSTGILRVTPEGETRVLKNVGLPPFLKLKEEDERKEKGWFFDSDGLVDGDCMLLMGHNRHATKGAHSTENAHPFEFGDIIGAHNGTINDNEFVTDNNYYSKKDIARHTVDSKILFERLGETHDFLTSYRNTGGAQCCLVWSKRENKLFMWRNVQRPLCVFYSKDGLRMAWASEEWIFQNALVETDSWREWEYDPRKVYNFPTDTLAAVAYGGDEVGIVEDRIRMEPVPFYQSKSYGYGTTGGNSNARHGRGGNGGSGGATVVGSSSFKTLDEKRACVGLNGPFPGFNLQPVSEMGPLASREGVTYDEEKILKPVMGWWIWDKDFQAYLYQTKAGRILPFFGRSEVKKFVSMFAEGHTRFFPSTLLLEGDKLFEYPEGSVCVGNLKRDQWIPCRFDPMQDSFTFVCEGRSWTFKAESELGKYITREASGPGYKWYLTHPPVAGADKRPLDLDTVEDVFGEVKSNVIALPDESSKKSGTNGEELPKEFSASDLFNDLEGDDEEEEGEFEFTDLSDDDLSDVEVEWLRGPDGKPTSPRDFAALLEEAQHCADCMVDQRKIPFGWEEIRWFGHSHYLCADCADKTIHQAYTGYSHMAH